MTTSIVTEDFSNNPTPFLSKILNRSMIKVILVNTKNKSIVNAIVNGDT